MTKIILSFIFIAVALGLIFGFVKPQYDAAEYINSEIAQYEKALSKAKEIQTLKRSLLAKYNLFEGNSHKLEKLLPNNVDNVRLVLDIDGIATSRGIRIGSVKVQKPKKKKSNNQASGVGFADAAQGAQPYQTITLEFAAVATYTQFKDFLQDLEHSLRIVDLVSLEVVKAQTRRQAIGKNGKKIINKDEPEKYKFTVGIRTYWLK